MSINQNKSTLNTIALTLGAAIFSQLVNTIVALFLPRLLILSYGSDFNGIVSAARQFSNYLAMIDSGMYAATCYQFIRAYSANDYTLVNQLYTTVGVFFRKTSYCVLGITVLLSIGYGIITISNVALKDVVYIFIMYSLGTIIAYYGFFKYNLVLFSNGKQYYITTVCAMFALLSLFGQWLTVILHGSMFLMVAIYPIAIIMRLFVLKYKTKKEHPYLRDLYPTRPELINQKWDSLVLNIADNMKTFAPIISISWRFGASFVSVYATYETVLHFGSSILITVLNGLVPTLGKDLTLNTKEAKTRFKLISMVVNYFSSIICICFSSMIVSFIYIYIGNKADINYQYPLLAFFMVISVWFLNTRTSYDLLIKANGHIKELRKGAVVEIVIAVGLCLLFSLSQKFVLIPLGVVISAAYRTIRMCLFCSRKMSFDEKNALLKDMSVWTVFTALVSYVGLKLITLSTSVGVFLVTSFCVLVASIIICTLWLLVLDRSTFIFIINIIKYKILKRKKA